MRFLVEIKTWDSQHGDGFRYVERDLTASEAIHVAAHVADVESIVSAIVRLPEMTEAP